MRFSKAIVRKPADSFIHGITTSKLGVPDIYLARQQHQEYIKALEHCGLELTILDPLEDFPDSVFVEDVAVVNAKGAIITRPGALSRKDEIRHISQLIEDTFPYSDHIRGTATLDGGDIMQVDDQYFVGLSKRTNMQGFEQFKLWAQNIGMLAFAVPTDDLLHLKTAFSYLENNWLAVQQDMLSDFWKNQFNLLVVPKDEGYAANCIWINDHIIMAAGFPKTKQVFEQTKYEIIELDVSEFQKMDGGLSCLSLRY